MIRNEITYLKELEYININGRRVKGRTEEDTFSIFGRQARYDLSDSFPIPTTKKLFLNGVFRELLWFLKGSTNIKELQENHVHIWDEWADENGDLGPVYGSQWRSFAGAGGKIVDQIQQLERGLRSNPTGRRHIVSAWNPAEIDQMALPPCHVMWQLYCTPLTAEERSRHERINGYESEFGLSCMLTQRSADYFLGVPFNIASYAALTQMLAHAHNMAPMELVHSIGDAHIYANHLGAVATQLSRTPNLSSKRLKPKLRMARKCDSILDYKFEDFLVENYEPQPAIAAPVSK